VASGRIIDLDPASWPTLSKLLDDWLDLAPEARSGWLDSLGPEYDPVSPVLRRLISVQAALGTYLDTLPTLQGSAESAFDAFTADMPIGPYRLIRELGRGGMGVVWLAERADGALKRSVALKFPFGPVDRRLTERFARERDVLAQLVHPHITRLYDAGIAGGGQPYIAMEYVDGEALTTYSDCRMLTIKMRLILFLEVLRAVQYAHTNLVVHRDLKPSNMLVTRDGEVRLLDFGIAKLLTEGEAWETELTRIGGRAFTPDYASPEQIVGEPITTASDVYSLGVVFCELLTGEKPYRLKRDTRGGLEEAIVVADAIRPSQIPIDDRKARFRGSTPKRIARTLRGDLDTIVLKSLQKQPQRRYASADAFAQDVERYLNGEAVLAQPESAWYRTRKFVLRNRLPVASAAAIVVALSIGLGTALWQTHIALTEKRRADTEAATARAVNDFLQNDLLAQASPNSTGLNNKPDPDLKVRTALDRAAARIQGRFENHPLVEAAIRQTISASYMDLGHNAEAMQQLERALVLRRHALGEQHRETLDTISRLGEACWAQGQYPRAEQLYTKALDLQRRTLGSEHGDTLRTMANLAVLYSDQGKYPQAEILYNRTLELQRRFLGDQHHDTLSTMNNLAVLYRQEDKYPQAELLYTKLVDIRLRVLGEQHPDTLRSVHNLATLYSAERKFGQAEPLFGKVLELRHRVLGDEHPNTLASMNALAGMYRDQERYSEAETLFGKVLDLRRRVLGEQHPETLITTNALAGVYLWEGKYSDAEPLLRKVWEFRSRVLGEEHPDTLDTMHKLGLMYLRQGKYAQAEPLLTKALETQRRVLGENHSDTLGSMSSLAALRRSQGQYGQAQAIFAKVLEIRRRLFSAQDRDIADVLASLGEVLLLQRRYAEAEPMLREALGSQEKAMPASWRRYRTESLLGRSLAGQKKYTEAEARLISGYQGMLQRQASIPFDERTAVRQSGQWLIQLYRQRGRLGPNPQS
jgi:serine/threonine protein kinase/Tfp pilus assembly protein PilF